MTISVVFCWTDISGYMAACWRVLQKHPSISLHVIAFQARTETAFSDNLMKGISSYLLDLNERYDLTFILENVIAAKPDIVVSPGWFHKPYRQLAFESDLKKTKFIMGMDTPWQGNLRQQLAPLLLRSYIKRMAHVVVTGERSWQYAKHLGADESRIHKGLYGIDYGSWSDLLSKRQQTAWPRSFLFVGRYVPVKAINILVAAYQKYRAQVSDPWPLACCGKGKLATLLDSQPGIENKGFVQPDEMLLLWKQAGAFVLPSLFDPWPLSLVEAAAAGLPIICTHACGSAVEVVRPWYNGLTISANSVEQLAASLLTMHQQYDNLPQWGMRSQSLASPYSAEAWVQRWYPLLQETVAGRSH